MHVAGTSYRGARGAKRASRRQTTRKGHRTGMSFDGELQPVDAKKGRAEDLSVLARSSALNVIGGLAFGLFSFASLVIIDRGLGVKRSGTLLEAIALFTIATSVVVLGSEESVVRAVSRAVSSGAVSAVRGTLLAALVPLLALAMLAATFAWMLAPEVASLFDGNTVDPELVTYLRFFGLALPFAAAYFPLLAATRGFGTMTPTVAIERVGRTAAQALGLGIAVGAGGDAMTMALVWVLPFVVGSFFAAWQLHRLIRQADVASSDRAARPPLADVATEFWRFSSLRGLASIFQTAFLYTDTLIVGALVSSSATGIYTTSGRMVRLGSLILLAIMQAVAPQISDLLARGHISRAEHVYRVATWWLMSLTWPIYITMGIFAPVLLRIFGVQFSTGAGVVATMSGAMLLSTAIGPVDMVLLMGGKSGWNLINSALGLSANLILNFLLVPHLGIEGAAIAWAASVALNNLLPCAEIRAILGISPFARPGAVPALGSAIAFGVVGCIVRATLGPSVGGLLLSVTVGTGLYVLLLLRFGASLGLGSLAPILRLRLPAKRWTDLGAPK